MRCRRRLRLSALSCDPMREFSVVGVAVPSGVSHTPCSRAELMAGARGRCEALAAPRARTKRDLALFCGPRGRAGRGARERPANDVPRELGDGGRRDGPRSVWASGRHPAAGKAGRRGARSRRRSFPWPSTASPGDRASATRRGLGRAHAQPHYATRGVSHRRDSRVCAILQCARYTGYFRQVSEPGADLFRECAMFGATDDVQRRQSLRDAVRICSRKRAMRVLLADHCGGSKRPALSDSATRLDGFGNHGGCRGRAWRCRVPASSVLTTLSPGP